MGSIRQEARQALEKSHAFVWSFWKRDKLRLEQAQKSLDRMEASAAPEELAVIRLTRKALEARPSIDVARLGLETLAQPIPGNLAGIALCLADKAHNHEQLLPMVATPEDQEMLAFCRELDADPQTQLRLLAQKAPPPSELLRARLKQVQGLGTEARKHFQRQALESLTRPPCTRSQWVADWVREHPHDRDSRKLAIWALEEAPPEWRALFERLQSQPGEACGILLTCDQPYCLDTLAEAARISLSRDPNRARSGAWLNELTAQARREDDAPRREAIKVLGRLDPDLIPEGLSWLEHDIDPAGLASRMLPRAPARVLSAYLEQRPGATSDFLKATRALDLRQPAQIWERALKAASQGASLPEMAYRCAGATDYLGEKLTLVQQGLSTMHQRAHPDERPALEMVHAFTRLSGHKNALWLRTALGLEGLRQLHRYPVPTTPGKIAELGVRILDSPAMVPSWRKPVAHRILDALAEIRPAGAALIAQTRQKIDQGGAAHELLRELADSLQGLPIPQRGNAVGEAGESLLVGGVKIARKGRQAKGSLPNQMRPSDTQALGVEKPRDSRQCAIRFEKSSQRVQGVYNPETGGIEWQRGKRWAGVYDPLQGGVLWRSTDQDSIAALYNVEKRAPRFEAANKCSLAGLWNPVQQRERFDRVYSGCRAGAVDPLTGQERWETSFTGSTAGVYDPKKEDFRFETNYLGSIVAVSDDPACPTLASGGTSIERAESCKEPPKPPPMSWL